MTRDRIETTSQQTVAQQTVTRPRQRPRLALLVNIIAPYRVPVYRRIGEFFETAILFSGEETNRDSWQNVAAELDGVTIKKARGGMLQFLQGAKGKVYDYKFLHINPGYLFDLIKYKPQAVITIEMGFRTLAALLYGTLFRKPVWIWWGGTLHTERHVGGLKAKIRRWIVKRAKHWISYGETSTEYLLSIGVSKSRIVQIQNCVEEQKFLTPLAPSMEMAPKPVFLCVGQLIRRKGVDKLLEAAAVVQKEGYEFSLLFVGGGPERDSLVAQAAELGLQNVHFERSRPPEDLPALYRSADFLVFPTLEDVWGLVVNEAMWSDLPVLSSVYAGCTKELLPVENHFDPLDLDDFVQALKRALNGEIGLPERAHLKTCTEVADLIVSDIQRVIGRGEASR